MNLIASLLIFLSNSPLASTRGMWSGVPASYNNLISEAYPVGNGKLGALSTGSPGADIVNINVDSLWSGGPFLVENYTGGNPANELYSNLPSIREVIWTAGTGDLTPLLGSGDYYGSYATLGNFSVVMDGAIGFSSYNRSLDFDSALHTTTYKDATGNNYLVELYCSYPDQVCVYTIDSTGVLPNVTISFENQFLDQSLLKSTCSNGRLTMAGVMQKGPPVGMKFEAIAEIAKDSGLSICTDGVLVVPTQDVKKLTIVVGGGTNYDQTKGNTANNFSFQGADPGPYLVAKTSSAAAKGENLLRLAHIEDYQKLSTLFSLDLLDPLNSTGLETSVIFDNYKSTEAGNPYLESLLFAYSRHLFISSCRENSLPPNLQGKWNPNISADWGSDYHLDINLQMNLWGAVQTGLGDLQVSVWNFIQDTVVPRGTETAELLYGATAGWVTHDEMNIFGYTGMKSEAVWADYPAAGAWMMQHVWDYYEYSQNITWLKTQGYPLIKGVVQFWLSQLQADEYTHDGTVVVNPCNSPEHGPTTFGCTHYQQLLYQNFEAIVSASSIINDPDTVFTEDVAKALKKLDKGLHIGSWNEIKEWKLPESAGFDIPGDTHRHLSHLVGWYPGHSIASFQGGYQNAAIQSAVNTSLTDRGPGIVDSNSGWEKVWRSACWARLNNSENAFMELQLAIATNFANNGLSLYNSELPVFQIDANFGLAGAILSMLVVDMPMLSSDTGVHTVVLGPAIPVHWSGGGVHGLSLRGGGTVDFSWDTHGLVTAAKLGSRQKPILLVNKNGKVLASQ